MCRDLNSYDSQLDKFGGNISICRAISISKCIFTWLIFGVNNILDHANLLGVILITLLLVVWINFVSSDLVQFISSSSIRPWCFLDHYLVDYVIDLSHFSPQDRVLWKFDNFLTDHGFCDHLSLDRGRQKAYSLFFHLEQEQLRKIISLE